MANGIYIGAHESLFTQLGRLEVVEEKLLLLTGSASTG
jgi:hypothetical protein